MPTVETDLAWLLAHDCLLPPYSFIYRSFCCIVPLLWCPQSATWAKTALDDIADNFFPLLSVVTGCVCDFLPFYCYFPTGFLWQERARSQHTEASQEAIFFSFYSICFMRFFISSYIHYKGEEGVGKKTWENIAKKVN